MTHPHQEKKVDTEREHVSHVSTKGTSEETHPMLAGIIQNSGGSTGNELWATHFGKVQRTPQHTFCKYLCNRPQIGEDIHLNGEDYIDNNGGEDE